MSVNKNKKFLFTLTILTLISCTTVIKQKFTGVDELVEDIASTRAYYPHIVKLDNDYFVISYIDTNSNKLYFQIYNPVGDKVGNNVQVGNSNCRFKRYIEALAANSFIIAGSDSGLITAYIYDYQGNFIKQFSVNNDMTGFLDTIDITRLDNSNVVISWNKDSNSVYYRIFTKYGNSVISSTLFLGSATAKRSHCVKGGANNIFALCWIMTSSPNDIVYCRIMNSTGGYVSGLLTVDTFPTASIDTMPLSIERTSSDDFVIVYSNDPSNYDMIFTIIDTAPSIIKSPTIVNSISGGFGTPDVSALSTGGFVITYFGLCASSCTKYNVYTQKYNSSYNTVGSNIVIPVNTSVHHLYSSVAGLSNGGYAVTWYSNNQESGSSYGDVYFNLWYGDITTITCQDVSIVLGTSYSTTIDFASSITDDWVEGVSVKFNTLPTVGQLKLTTNGSLVAANTAYANDILKFDSDTNYGSYSVIYTVTDYFGNVSSTCKLDIGICYSSCNTCTQVGNINNNKCLTCKPGYNSLNSMCYSTCPTNYGGSKHYTNQSAGKCIQCTSPCDECTDQFSCTTCAAGFVLLPGVTSNNCGTNCPTGYWKDEVPSCQKCSSLCTACTTSATTCTSCIATAYFTKDKNQCSTVCPDGYATDGQKNCIICQNI
jgi:hypothetical protein